MESLLNRKKEFNSTIIDYILQTLRCGSITSRMEVLDKNFHLIHDIKYETVVYIPFRQIENTSKLPQAMIWIPETFKNNVEVQSLLSNFDYYVYYRLQFQWYVCRAVYKDINVDNLEANIVSLYFFPNLKQIHDLFFKSYSKIFNDDEKKALNNIKKDIVKAIKHMCKGKITSIDASLLQKLKDFIDKNGEAIRDFNFEAKYDD
jgi:hypothetical protein